MNISKAVDKKLGTEREITGIGRRRSPAQNVYGGLYNTEYVIKDKPVTPEAKALNGSYAGLQLKPAIEVIIVSMKPLSEKSYVDQALKTARVLLGLMIAEYLMFLTRSMKKQRVK
ncbi:MAG: hypothetical protein ACP5MB_11635 [bacterium]